MFIGIARDGVVNWLYGFVYWRFDRITGNVAYSSLRKSEPRDEALLRIPLGHEVLVAPACRLLCLCPPQSPSAPGCTYKLLHLPATNMPATWFSREGAQHLPCNY